MYLCDVLDLFFLVSDKNNKSKKKSEAAKAYVSTSESDSDEHEVVSIYTVILQFVYFNIDIVVFWTDFILKTV